MYTCSDNKSVCQLCLPSLIEAVRPPLRGHQAVKVQRDYTMRTGDGHENATIVVALQQKRTRGCSRPCRLLPSERPPSPNSISTSLSTHYRFPFQCEDRDSHAEYPRLTHMNAGQGQEAVHEHNLALLSMSQ